MRTAFSAYQQVQEDYKKNQQVGHQLASQFLPRYWRNRTVANLQPIVVSAGITDPTNIGSIFRVCDAGACRKILFVDTPVDNLGRIKRVSRKLNEKIPHEFISSMEFIKMVSNYSNLVAIEITSKSTDVFITQLPQNPVFVIGGEQYGISEQILNLCSQAVHIPMLGIGGSMNVATSLGIVLYEWRRRFYPMISTKSFHNC